MLNKSIVIVALLILPTPALANEIAGTRVIGQGAVCSESQGKAVEYNIATKTESSYCIERPPAPISIPVPVVTPTPTPTPTPKPTVSETSTVTTGPVTFSIEPLPVPKPTAPQPPKLDVVTPKIDIIADVTNRTVVEKKRTIEEIIDLWLIDIDKWFKEWIAYMNDFWSW